MNIDVLREEIAADEGCVMKIYKDHLGYLTFGIGHLVKKTDVEHGFAVDTPVSRKRVNTVFAEDINLCMSDCQRWVKGFNDLPEEVQHILCNMMFNMGYTRMSKFRKLKENIEKKELVWCKQRDEIKQVVHSGNEQSRKISSKNESSRSIKCYQQS